MNSKLNPHQQESLLFDIISEPMITLDLDLRIQWANQNAGHIVNEDPENLVKQYCYRVIRGRQIPCEDCPVPMTIQMEKKQEIEKEAPDGRCHKVRSYPLHSKEGILEGVALVGLDISEFKQAEEELRNKEKYLQNILESQRELVVTVDLEHRFKYVNDAYCKTFGQTREKMLDKQFTTLVHEEDIEDTMRAMEELYVPPYLVYIEQQAMTVNGWRWIAWEYSAILDEQGHVVEILGVGRDITERKQMEKELREREAELAEQETLYRSIVEDHPHFVELFLPDTTIIYANKALAESIDYTPEELQGEKWIDFIPENERNDILDMLSSFSPESPVQTNENSFFDSYGSQRWHIWTNRAFFTEQGELRYFQSTGAEITERKLMESALRQSENYYRAIFETSGAAMFIIEEDTTISLVNSNFEKITGYSRQEVEGKKSWTKFLHPDDVDWMKKNHYLQRQNPDAASRQYEFRLKTRHGEWRDLSYTVAMIPGTNKSIGSGVDITKRKQDEESLRKIYNNTHDAIIIHDFNGKILDINDRMCQLYNLNKEEVFSCTIEDISSRNMCIDYLSEIWRKVLNNEKQLFEWEAFRPKDRIIFNVEVSLERIDIYNNPFIIANVRDVTERKKTEKALRESEERFRAVLENIPGGIFAHDFKGRIFLVNEQARINTGYSRDELLSMTVWDLDPYSATRDDQTTLCQRLETGESITIESNHIRKDGTKYPAEIHLNTLTLDGQYVILPVAFDVSRRKQFEQALWKSEQQFRTLFMESPVAIYIHDKDNGEIIDANPKAYASYCLSSVKELNSSEWIWMEHPYSYTEAMKWIRQATNEGPQQFEWKSRDIYGGLLWQLVRLIPMTINGVERVVATAVDITELKETMNALHQSENYYRAIFETSGSAMFIIEQDTTISLINTNFEKLSGYSSQEMEGKKSWIEFAHPDDVEWMKENNYLQWQDTNAAPRQYEFRFVTRHEEERNVLLAVDMIPGTSRSIASGIDITEHKQAENALIDNEKKLQAITDSAQDAIIMMDTQGNISYYNYSAEILFGYTSAEVFGQNVHYLLAPKCYHKAYEASFSEFQRTGQGYAVGKTLELTAVRKNGEEFPIELSLSSVKFHDGWHAVGTIRDITERKKMEEKLKEMSFRDSLTGLYNRNFFEEEMARLGDRRYNPIAIVVCDLDGLKFVNDSLGHQAGDQMLIQAADILRQNFRSTDIIARIGGDEFAVLLPEIDQEILEQILQRLRQAVKEYNTIESEIPLSLSIGQALREGGTADMQGLFREADNRMYREKIQREGSARSAILQALTGSMEARDFNTEGHCNRLHDLAASLARSLELSQELINDLFLLARFHDLGKVGIPDHILFKPGSLTEEEWQQMRQHCEIGHRIASSVPDLEPVADWILKHHERWDGHGYPLGVSGRNIPLPCRILAIADAYDAMTSDRPYRKAVTREEAVAELKRCAGTQFDPELVERFIETLEEYDEESL